MPPEVHAKLISPDIKGSIAQALGTLPASMSSIKALVLLYAIGLQESRFTERYQLIERDGRIDRRIKGPARGFWGFELGGGVVGVMTHPASAKHAERICELRGVEFDAHSIWTQLETDDVLAAAFARLLLWTDPFPLPGLNDPDDAWELYAKRLWRPGRPRRATWPTYHAAACLAADRRAIGRS
jgi:hypothetical protein